MSSDTNTEEESQYEALAVLLRKLDLPLTSLEAFAEISRTAPDIEAPESLLEFVRDHHSESSACEDEHPASSVKLGQEAPSAASTPAMSVASPTPMAVVDDRLLPRLVVQYVRTRGNRLAAVTVEEALGLEDSGTETPTTQGHSFGSLDAMLAAATGASQAAAVAGESSMNSQQQQCATQLHLSTSTLDCPETHSTNASPESTAAVTASENQAALLAAQEEIRDLQEQLRETRRRADRLEVDVANFRQRAQRNEGGDQASGGPEGALRFIADRLPTVIASVSTSKRDCMLPLLRSILEHHSAPTVRASMAFYTFGLYTRPTLDQRRSVVETIVSLSKDVDKDRFERDVVPELWQQVSHKYPERRCLAVESAAALAPLVSADTRAAFFSAIAVPLAQDPTPLVRESAAAAVGPVWGDLPPEKMPSAIDTCLRLYVDERPAVLQAMRHGWPLVVKRCRLQGTLGPVVIPTVVSAIARVLQSDGTADERASAATIAAGFLEALRTCIEQLVSATQSEDEDAADQTAKTIGAASQDAFPSFFALLRSPSGLSNPELLHGMAAHLAAITSLGEGKTLLLECVEPTLRTLMSSEDHAVRSASLGALLHHHCAYTGQEDTHVSHTLGELFASVVVHADGWEGSGYIDMVHAAVIQTAKNNTRAAQTLADAMWVCVHHEEPAVREACISLLVQLVSAAPADVTEKSIWSALIVLMNDYTAAVQEAAMRGVTFVTTLVRDEFAFIDKVFRTVFAQVDEAGPFSPLAQSMLSSWKTSMRNILPEVRERHIYAYIPSFCGQFAAQKASASAEERVATIRLLLDVFSAIAGCAVMSPAETRDHLLPSLRSLAKDVDAVPDVAAKQQFVALTKELTTIVAHGAPPKKEQSFFDKVKQELNNIVAKNGQKENNP